MLKQTLNQKLQQKLSPQQIQLMKLIQLPTLDFEAKIKEELEDNLALEEGVDEFDEFSELDYSEGEKQDESDEQRVEDLNIDYYVSDDEIASYNLQSDNYEQQDYEKNPIPYAGGISFFEYLSKQLNTYNLSQEDLNIAKYLVGSIDSDGYIRRNLSNIVDDMAFSHSVNIDVKKLEYLLTQYIHRLDPLGVGARSLKECLLIQLKNRPKNADTERAKILLTNYFDKFAKKHYKNLISSLNCNYAELKNAIKEIERLNPKPGKTYSESSKIVEQITPDFTLHIVDGKIELSLEGRNIPDLKISTSYMNMLKAYKESTNKSKEQKKAVMFVKQKLDSAKWFIDAVKQRQRTLYVSMSAIIELQKEYFMTGDERKIRPMILKDVADEVMLDISTISRVASSKYISTPYGTFLLKHFFSEGIKNKKGEDISTREIKTILHVAIEKENKKKPLTDGQLSKLLTKKGYTIARRTIAKYREQFNIPVARLRKEL